MQFFGLTISRAKALPALSPVSSRGGWWPLIRETFTGAWQKNVTVNLDTVLTYSTVYACISLIASDISKLRLRLVAQDDNGIWSEAESAAFSPVLRKPNHFQTRIKFIEQWVTSKLIHGNTYALKVRDDRGVVVRLYILDPMRVKPLVAPDGSVFYELCRDDLSGLEEDGAIAVPAREIIHDMMVTLYHPLVGVSPIHACGLAATQGIRIQENSAKFFGNNSQPGGILTAPGFIHEETAARLKAHWDANFTGANVGKVAVLGDGLKYEPMSVNAVDAQLIEQLKWTAETVCSCFHVPPYMVGVGQAPSYNNIEALNQQYYSQCLQVLIESIELCLDEGLELKKPYGTEFDLDDLLRMDTATMMKSIAEGIKAGVMMPDEGRKKLNYKPVPGGNTPYMQEQNWPLRLLAERELPTREPTAPKPLPPPVEEETEEEDDGDERRDYDEQRDYADIILQAAKRYERLEAA